MTENTSQAFDQTAKVRAQIAALKQQLESEADPEIQAAIQDEILSISHSWFVEQMLIDEAS